MPSHAQAETASRKLDKQKVLIALARRDMKQIDLAERIGHAASTVNLAINRGLYPNVIRKIRKELAL